MSSQNINIEKYDFDSFEVEKQPFTMIPNSVIQKTTNPEATFMWIYLQSMPSTWKPNKQHLMSHFNISERTYERRMGYLNTTGLIEYRQERNESGTFGGWKLIILNGARFNPMADSNRSAKIGGVVCHRSAKKPLNGETDASVNGGHINTTKEIKEIKERINISEQNLSEKKEENKDRFNYLDESEKFKEFWNEYPIKKQFNQCKSAWYSQHCDEEADAIINKLKEQKAKDSDFIEGFAPNPFTYITQERWNDDLKIKPLKTQDNVIQNTKKETDEERMKRYALEREQQKRRNIGEIKDKLSKSPAPIRLSSLLK
jgi:hypothetical protein